MSSKILSEDRELPSLLAQYDSLIQQIRSVQVELTHIEREFDSLPGWIDDIQKKIEIKTKELDDKLTELSRTVTDPPTPFHEKILDEPSLFPLIFELVELKKQIIVYKNKPIELQNRKSENTSILADLTTRQRLFRARVSKRFAFLTNLGIC